MAMTHADLRDGLVEELDAHVHEVVRREGVDPQVDADLVRRIAETVVREHDERSLTGVVARVADVEALVGELVARVAGFGPLQPFLDTRRWRRCGSTTRAGSSWPATGGTS
jgi:pilus assembly protein CpaF